MLPIVNETLHIQVENRGRIIILHFRGDFFADRLNDVEKIWREQIARKPRIIAINCAGIEHVDSSSLSTLVKFLNEAMEKNIRLIFYDLNPSLQNLFEIARLQRFFFITTREKFEKKFLQTA